jgi:tRNA(fMet)-specific endonuclease VapC
MSYCYLLDTNILSDLVKHPTGKIFSKIQSIGEEKVCTSVVVACELRFGAEKNNSSRLKERIALILDNIF